MNELSVDEYIPATQPEELDSREGISIDEQHETGESLPSSRSRESDTKDETARAYEPSMSESLDGVFTAASRNIIRYRDREYRAFKNNFSARCVLYHRRFQTLLDDERRYFDNWIRMVSSLREKAKAGGIN